MAKLNDFPAAILLIAVSLCCASPSIAAQQSAQQQAVNICGSTSNYPCYGYEMQQICSSTSCYQDNQNYDSTCPGYCTTSNAGACDDTCSPPSNVNTATGQALTPWTYTTPLQIYIDPSFDNYEMETGGGLVSTPGDTTQTIQTTVSTELSALGVSYEFVDTASPNDEPGISFVNGDDSTPCGSGSDGCTVINAIEPDGTIIENSTVTIATNVVEQYDIANNTLLEAIAKIVAHETGHTQGLADNYSSYEESACSDSTMDYQSTNSAAPELQSYDYCSETDDYEQYGADECGTPAEPPPNSSCTCEGEDPSGWTCSCDGSDYTCSDGTLANCGDDGSWACDTNSGTCSGSGSWYECWDSSTPDCGSGGDWYCDGGSAAACYILDAPDGCDAAVCNSDGSWTCDSYGCGCGCGCGCGDCNNDQCQDSDDGCGYLSCCYPGNWGTPGCCDPCSCGDDCDPYTDEPYPPLLAAAFQTRGAAPALFGLAAVPLIPIRRQRKKNRKEK